MFQGGWFSFNASRDQWTENYAEKMYEVFFNSPFISEKYSGYTVTDEMLITNNLQYNNIKHKSVLVIGGGPSSETLTKEMLTSYDYVFSCNHFYKNNFLKQYKVHLALVGDEVNLRDPEFIDFIKKNNTIVGFEHSSRRSISETLRFKTFHAPTFIYLTRYFSRLGYVARACVLARLMGATTVHFIGLDGFKTNAHYFEKTKVAPPFNNESMFREQMRIFYRYMLRDLSIPPDNFKNLSEEHESSIYGGIMTEVIDEVH
tara:strand:+ start:1854 stop:2630 length:777 start_codon:yes stop_codon:yes gene_type:complete